MAWSYQKYPCLYWIICIETQRPAWTSSSPLIFLQQQEKHRSSCACSFKFQAVLIYIWHIVLGMFIQRMAETTKALTGSCNFVILRCLAFTSLKASWHVPSRPTGFHLSHWGGVHIWEGCTNGGCFFCCPFGGGCSCRCCFDTFLMLLWWWLLLLLLLWLLLLVLMMKIGSHWITWINQDLGWD